MTSTKTCRGCQGVQAPMIPNRFGVAVLTIRASTSRSSARSEMGRTSLRAVPPVMECLSGSVTTSPTTATAMSIWSRSAFWLTTFQTLRQPSRDIGVMLEAASIIIKQQLTSLLRRTKSTTSAKFSSRCDRRTYLIQQRYRTSARKACNH